MIATFTVGALVAAGASSAVAASAPTAVGVARALYAQGPNGAACAVPQPSGQRVAPVSYTGCPVSAPLAQSLTEYAGLKRSDPRCRCQNSFSVTVSSKLAKPPSRTGGRRPTESSR